MSEFLAYLQLGFDHITDSKGYDHILFIMALCTIYTLVDWKKVIILVTAFTIGHSITLALATVGIIKVNPNLVELFIPITILITAALNFFHRDKKGSSWHKESSYSARYPLALFFGLIHGMGFSNYLRVLLGKEAVIFTPLLGFNIGLELGQLIIVFIVLSVAFLMIEILRVQKISWIQILSGIIFGMSLSLIINNKIFQT